MHRLRKSKADRKRRQGPTVEPSHEATAVVVDGLPDYILAALDRVGLSRRKYQKTASFEALSLLRRGENAEINLPPGTGKTLISQIIACIWLREGRASSQKVLCVVPSSTLREQHYDFCGWWAKGGGLCRPLEISSRWLDDKGVWHQMNVSNSDFWFALPEVFCNAVDTAYISMEQLDLISLVILDEYDAFSIAVLRAEGERLRFSKDCQRLLNLLEKRERRYLLMSATPARHREDE
jgi:superfamily II DNA or RNA helicase